MSRFGPYSLTIKFFLAVVISSHNWMFGWSAKSTCLVFPSCLESVCCSALRNVLLLWCITVVAGLSLDIYLIVLVTLFGRSGEWWFHTYWHYHLLLDILTSFCTDWTCVLKVRLQCVSSPRYLTLVVIVCVHLSHWKIG